MSESDESSTKEPKITYKTVRKYPDHNNTEEPPAYKYEDYKDAFFNGGNLKRLIKRLKALETSDEEI